MAPQAVDAVTLGQRVSLARIDASMSQAELAAAIGLNRTGVVRIEAGERKISAAELVSIADALGRPIDWFVTESPPAVVSLRALPGVHSRRLDLSVEQAARDVAFLRERGVLSDELDRTTLGSPTDVEGAEQAAAKARLLLVLDGGPVLDLQQQCERLGMLVFALDLGPDGGDAAYVEVESLGVAVVNTAIEAGRRRFSVAHELGHHLFGDAFESRLSGPRDSTESLIDAFAVHFLLPRGPVTALWQEWAPSSRRLAAVAIAARFRASWTATCNQLKNLGLVKAAERKKLNADTPTKAEFVAVGMTPEPEMGSVSVPPKYGSLVMAAFRRGELTSEKTVELLWGTVDAVELPERDTESLESLRRSLEPLA